MIDIQSATAENRRGKKERKEKEETTGGKIECPHLIRRAAIKLQTIYATLSNSPKGIQQKCTKIGHFSTTKRRGIW